MRKINILNRKKIIIAISVSLCILALIILFLVYVFNGNFRSWIDINVLRKNISEKDIQTISLNTDKNNQIHVYNNYISVLNDKTITLYNSYGEKITSIDININSALFDSSQKYLAIAEENGHEICLLFDKTYLWGEKLEGEILQIHVNKNGYVVAISTDATHKSILTFFNPEGKKLFTSYFATTRIVDASISNDNKYIAIGELDTSGTIIKSNVKILSVKNAQENPENTVEYMYKIDDGILITNVKYQSKNQIACILDNGLGVIKDNTYKEIVRIENDQITYLTNNFNNHVAYIEEETTGLFKAQSNVHIVNTSDFQEKIYKLDYATKDIFANDSIIALNIGTEIYFIDTNGWLKKKYTANQEITNVKFSENLATIIYKDKIIIVNL